MRLVERIEAVDRGEATRREVILAVSDAEVRAELVAAPDAEAKVVSGVAAGSGFARGRLIASSSQAAELRDTGRAVVLVMEDAEAEDVPGIAASRAVITLHGITGGAAIIARGHGKPCVAVGAALSLRRGIVRLSEDDVVVPEESAVGVDASRGRVWFGRTRFDLGSAGARLVRWASRYVEGPIIARVDDASEVASALKLGARGAVDAAGRMFVVVATTDTGSAIDLEDVPVAVVRRARERISRGGR